jgi:Chitobiase/beta-hexosaminidase C-terminal domain
MKTKSSLIRSIGVLLALLVFVALPGSTALANCGQCADVDIYFEYAGPTGIVAEMECEFPAGAIIFYTVNGTNPTHTGATPGSGTYIYSGPIPVPYLHCIHIKARAWKDCYTESANITAADICNPVD